MKTWKQAVWARHSWHHRLEVLVTPLTHCPNDARPKILLLDTDLVLEPVVRRFVVHVVHHVLPDLSGKKLSSDPM